MACGREGRGQVAAVGGLQLQAAWRPSVVGVRSSAKRLQRGAPPRPSRARGGPPASKSGPPASLFFPSQNGPPRRANGGRHRRAILPLHPAGCSLHAPTGPRRSGQGIPSPPLTQQPSTSGATGGEGGVGRGGVVARGRLGGAAGGGGGGRPPRPLCPRRQRPRHRGAPPSQRAGLWRRAAATNLRPCPPHWRSLRRAPAGPLAC